MRGTKSAGGSRWPSLRSGVGATSLDIAWRVSDVGTDVSMVPQRVAEQRFRAAPAQHLRGHLANVPATGTVGTWQPCGRGPRN